MIGAVVLAAALAAGPNPAARLRYSPGLTNCPAKADLRGAVAARLGYQPFDDGATDLIAAEVTREGDHLVAKVERFDASGRSVGVRRLSSSGIDCGELAARLELAISIAIDPLSLTRSPAPAPPTPSILVMAPPPPAPPAAPGPKPHLWITAGGSGSLGLTPQPTGGPVIGVELRYPLFSMGIEGQDDLPTSVSAETGTVQASALFGTLLPCFRERYFGVCAVVSIGGQPVETANITPASRQTAPWVAVGGRLLGELPIGGYFSLRLAVDVVAPVTSTTIETQSTSQTVWTTPSVAGDALLLLAVRLH